jgi:uncharacterized protein YndB with AHSA1/START domain
VSQVSFTFTVDRPRDEVYDLIGDLAAHEQWCDHFLTDWHIEGDPRAVGAVLSARAKGAGRYNVVELTVVESTPERTVEHGRGGKGLRRATSGVYAMKPLGDNRTEITFVNAVTEWANPLERLLAPLATAYMRKQSGRAMERLQALLSTPSVEKPSHVRS